MSVTTPNGGRAVVREGAGSEPDREFAADNRIAFERFETVFQGALALTIAAGVATMFGRGAQAPQADDASARGVLVARPREAASPAPSAAGDPLFAISALVKNPAVKAALSAMPAHTPEPLSPPTSELRDKLEGRRPARDGAPDGAAPALAYAPTTEGAAPAQTPIAAAEEAPTSKCYVKLSGRVEAKGPCLIRKEGERIAFELPGKTLALSHERGRLWTATLDGRVLGKAYRRGACWAAPRLYVCDRG